MRRPWPALGRSATRKKEEKYASFLKEIKFTLLKLTTTTTTITHLYWVGLHLYS